MRVYTVHLRRHGLDPYRDLVLVKEGFSWPAFFLSAVWALGLGLWPVVLILVAVEAALAGLLAVSGADPAASAILSLSVAVVFGTIGNDLRRWTLRRRGFVPEGVVLGEGRWAAERRFLEGRADVARAMGT